MIQPTHYDFALSISKDVIAEMPMVHFDGQIDVITTIDGAHSAFQAINKESIIGFDTETRPSFQKERKYKVALVQISTLTHSYLFRINLLGMFDEMHEFIENANIIKIGLSLKDDFFTMHRAGDFEPAGFLDLQSYVKQFAIADAGLQRIYALLFGQRISKGQRLSNWEADNLSPAQCHYAAIDAWACLRIYNYLNSGAFNPYDSPYRIEESHTTKMAK